MSQITLNLLFEREMAIPVIKEEKYYLKAKCNSERATDFKKIRCYSLQDFE
jgi:hypothetical protein